MIKILHGADLHLDSPFCAFSPEQAQQYRALQRQLPGKLTELANARGCQILVLAGDVFDSVHVYPETVQALTQALAQFRGHVFIAPGNHDHYMQLWDRAWPCNVHIFRTEYECVTLPELGCCVHGGAFLDTVCQSPIPPVKEQHYTQIGVYHGEFGDSSFYRPVTKEQITESGLDYLALGHVHKRSFPRLLGKTWFGWPGVTMSRGFDEPGDCGVFCVQLHEGGCAAEFIPLETPVFETLTVQPGTDPVLPPHSERTHCRMRFVGRSAPLDVQALHRKYEKEFLSLQILDETRPEEELWAACGDGTLRGLALELLREEPDGELAAQYLLAALDGREQP